MIKYAGSLSGNQTVVKAAFPSLLFTVSLPFSASYPQELLSLIPASSETRHWGKRNRLVWRSSAEENISQKRGHCHTGVVLLSSEEPLSTEQSGRRSCMLQMGPGRGPTGGTCLHPTSDGSAADLRGRLLHSDLRIIQLPDHGLCYILF